MNDSEWMEWGKKLRWLIEQSGIEDHLAELGSLADAVSGEDSDYLERNNGSGWTWDMAWEDEVARLFSHLELFDPQSYDEFVARQAEQEVES